MALNLFAVFRSEKGARTLLKKAMEMADSPVCPRILLLGGTAETCLPIVRAGCDFRHRPVILRLAPGSLASDCSTHACPCDVPGMVRKAAGAQFSCDVCASKRTVYGVGIHESGSKLPPQNRQLAQPGGITDSNGGYRLADGSVRAPNAGWITPQRLQRVTREQRDTFQPGAPDFAVELRSPSDPLRELQEKMQVWIRNGVQLAWLIDPEQRAATIYRPGREPERLDTISQVAGEGTVAGFVLPLDRIFR